MSPVDCLRCADSVVAGPAAPPVELGAGEGGKDESLESMMLRLGGSVRSSPVNPAGARVRRTSQPGSARR